MASLVMASMGLIRIIRIIRVIGYIDDHYDYGLVINSILNGHNLTVPFFQASLKGT